jgi:hypothetical protein
MNDFFGNDDANAERNLVCEFEGCGKRYSTEHSRRQHYRYGITLLVWQDNEWQVWTRERHPKTVLIGGQTQLVVEIFLSGASDFTLSTTRNTRFTF